MPLYQHRICDRSGRTLHHEELEYANLREAMIGANHRIGCMSLGRLGFGLAPVWRIEIADDHGHALARIYCGDAGSAPAAELEH